MYRHPPTITTRSTPGQCPCPWVPMLHLTPPSIPPSQATTEDSRSGNGPSGFGHGETEGSGLGGEASCPSTACFKPRPQAAGSRISVDFERKDEIGDCSGDGAGDWVGRWFEERGIGEGAAYRGSPFQIVSGAFSGATLGQVSCRFRGVSSYRKDQRIKIKE